ncbi:SCF E3 ubiquitin ligase complex F-box protein GrrA [Penicillium expansum]|uniref:SCF E3 ubiquitin ligase complex F-box protein GrrA n=1 Tax=Penicillium expansum TaxID=27334 RepID=A0A0A2J8A4_PENEN|nr:SCF E3 ubiquitin ligase complex F-box protein GrrA [Penicillium expansum]KGO36410.1 SCF E3 ubiquitin ligase complex F-box protein GrrA [Penicillium expansum]KGO50908.1 SCF E3 ubiquitin ligase complex F-box protein GrrA [Penicillium expansum]KGO63797.1 SCF E3 ubiquitin ligase complex F-box protein GrrA [Penicillium expansum]
MHRLREAGRCSSAAPSETSGSTSPERAADDDTDFFMAQANDSQSSIGVANFRDSRLSSELSEPLPPIGRLPPEILIAIFSKLVAPSDMLNSMLVCRGWAANSVGILWHRPSCNTWANVRSVTTSLGKPDSLFNYADLIKRLNLSALSDDVSDGTILSFNQCKRIERLTLTSCKNLTDKGVSDLVEGNRHLQALDVSELRHLTDHTLATVSRDCPRLQGLNITGCSKVTDDALLIVSQKCRQIKRLKLNGVSNVSDRAIQSFAENCPSILEIDLHDCKLVTSISVTPLLTTLRHLRELRLAHCTEVDDNAFLSLPPQMTFDSLRILDLTACENVRDDSVERIVRAAPRLRNLVGKESPLCAPGALFEHFGLGRDKPGQVLQPHSQLATLPKLRRIGLVKCQAITDQSILALARPKMGHHPSVSSLERVHLSYCVQLRMKGIHALLNSCPRLTHLSLTGVQEFLRENLTAFCREAPPEFTQQQRDVFCVFSGDGVNRLRDHLNRSEPQFHEEAEATMYDDDEELDEDEGQMAGLMNATVINDGDDDYIDVGPLNT